jgi:Spy/CpxP family protein refolding chaperone
MNRIVSIALSALMTLTLAGAARAADKLEERIAGSFFLPEQVRKSAELLNLSEEQKGRLQAAAESGQQKVEQLKQQAEAEGDKFIELAKPAKVDEKALVAQGDKLLDLDHQIKRAQLSLLIAIKNELTETQQAVLNQLKALDPKLKQARQLADQWKADGRDVAQFEGAKAEFESQLRAGQLKEAEATLDRVLQALAAAAGK